MTQKELLYMEDAINHEVSMINILNDSIDRLSDEDLIDFMNKEVKKHTNLKSKLLKKLGECCDEG